MLLLPNIWRFLFPRKKLKLFYGFTNIQKHKMELCTVTSVQLTQWFPKMFNECWNLYKFYLKNIFTFLHFIAKFPRFSRDFHLTEQRVADDLSVFFESFLAVVAASWASKNYKTLFEVSKPTIIVFIMSKLLENWFVGELVP